MLAADSHEVAAPQPGVGDHVEPYPLLRADRPALLVARHLVLGPHLDPGALLALRVLYVGSRIGLDVLGLLRPPEQAAHGVEEVAGLGRRARSALAARRDRVGRDPGEGLLA